MRCEPSLPSGVSLAYDIAIVSTEFGRDTDEVTEAIGLDDRVSERFLGSVVA